MIFWSAQTVQGKGGNRNRPRAVAKKALALDPYYHYSQRNELIGFVIADFINTSLGRERNQTKQA
jgi:hypothetical protein